MFYISDIVADNIYTKIKSIIEFDDENWKQVDIINKIRYLHHTLNFFDDTKKKTNSLIEIPLKSINN